MFEPEVFLVLPMPGRAALADVRRDEQRNSGAHAIALLHQLLSSLSSGSMQIVLYDLSHTRMAFYQSQNNESLLVLRATGCLKTPTETRDPSQAGPPPQTPSLGCWGPPRPRG